MAKRFQVEPRASEKYPWQVVDLSVNRDGVVSIHRTKRKAHTALYELKKEMRQQARIDQQWAAPESDLGDEVSGFRIDAANDIVEALEYLTLRKCTLCGHAEGLREPEGHCVICGCNCRFESLTLEPLEPEKEGENRLCLLCGHCAVAPDGTCMAPVPICSDDYHGTRRCGCKCNFTAVPIAPKVISAVLVDREVAAQMAFDAVKAALTSENNYSTLQVAATVAANIRRLPAASPVAPVEQIDEVANRVNAAIARMDTSQKVDVASMALEINPVPAPSAAIQDERCKCGLDKDNPIHSFSTEWQPMHKFTPRSTALNLSSLARKAATEIAPALATYECPWCRAHPHREPCCFQCASARDDKRLRAERVDQITAIIERCLSEGEA